MGIENPVHLLFIAVIALVVLGPKRLPEVTRALGHGIREFREAVSQQGTATQAPPGSEPAVPQEAQVAQPAVATEPVVLATEPPAVAPEPVAAEPVGPTQAIPSGDAPDRGPL